MECHPRAIWLSTRKDRKTRRLERKQECVSIINTNVFLHFLYGTIWHYLVMLKVLIELKVFRKQHLYIHEDSGKVYVHSTLPRPHLWDISGYVTYSPTLTWCWLSISLSCRLKKEEGAKIAFPIHASISLCSWIPIKIYQLILIVNLWLFSIWMKWIWIEFGYVECVLPTPSNLGLKRVNLLFDKETQVFANTGISELPQRFLPIGFHTLKEYYYFLLMEKW